MFAARQIDNMNSSDQENDEAADDQALIPETVFDTKQCIKSRTVLGIMGFLGFANVYAMRVNLSVAIVAMVNSSAIPDSTNSSLDVCPIVDPINNSSVPLRPGDFDWSETQRGVILGSFFYGYVLTQVPGGRFAELFGGKLVFGLGVLLTAIFTLLSPAAAYCNYTLFIVVRILEGVAEGVTFPAMHAMLARWIPPEERSKFAAIVYAGSNFGSVVSFPLSGWLCTLEWGGGWPLCFYLFGGLGIVWFIAWIFLVYDTPQSHPRICRQELEYIRWTIGIHVDAKARPIPWGHFLRSLPLWAILVTQCGLSWQFYTQLTELPTYMNNILHMKLQQNALLTAIPYLTSWFAGIFISVFADWLVAKHYISRLNSYKLWNTVASVIPSVGLLGVAWVGCDKVSVLLLLSITGAFGGAVYAGNQMNHIALSPHYAGTMYGITNAAANICGFVAPYAIGLIIEGQETLSQWRVVFYLAAAINLACNLFYLAFAGAEEEKWSIEVSSYSEDDISSSPLLNDSANVSS
ncbi:putative inorganic phosphate cotransporter [Arctopsyche grandis]|uniref:putative inorganic phosphate cotransporter n=1 Tax=Arctopsyche grandis TaxID=121162 RepID=UPI00406D67BB